MASTGTSSFKLGVRSRGGPILWLALGGVLLIAAITIGATLMAGDFRERALRNSERELENTVLLLARHFDQQLADFEVVQNDLIALMAVASGVVAYTGTYTLDESTKTAHLNIETSSVPNLVGAPNQRRIITSITDEELKLTNPRTPAGVTLELVFKRAK